MRALHEHAHDDDDKSDSSYLDSENGSTRHIDATDLEMTTIHDEVKVAAAAAEVRFSQETDGDIADAMAAAQQNQWEGGSAPHVDAENPCKAKSSAGAEVTEDIWGCIAEARAPEQDHSDGILQWALSRSLG